MHPQLRLQGLQCRKRPRVHVQHEMAHLLRQEAEGKGEAVPRTVARVAGKVAASKPSGKWA